MCEVPAYDVAHGIGFKQEAVVSELGLNHVHRFITGKRRAISICCSRG